MAVSQGSAGPLEWTTAGQAMSPGVLTVDADAPLGSVAGMMARHGVHALVVAPHGAPIRVLGDLELVAGLLADHGTTQAADVARQPRAVARPHDTLAVVSRLMADRDVDHVLVSAPGARLPMGVVSSLDVVAVVGRHPLRGPRPDRPRAPAGRLSRVLVHDAMHAGLVSCAPDTSLERLARILAEHRVHCAVVVGADRRGDSAARHPVWRLVTAHEVARAATPWDPALTAGDVATAHPTIVDENRSMEHAATLMVGNAAAHLVAVSRTGLPTGIVSTLDVATLCATADPGGHLRVRPMVSTDAASS